MSNGSIRPSPHIEPSANGPYLVRNLEKLSNSKGAMLETKETVALCRCGQSNNKPFCDGTHATVGFDGSKLTDGSLNKRDDYTAGRLTVHDNRGICAHAARCTDELPSVFKLGTEPWIDTAGADEATVAAQVRRCPSGALSHSIDHVESRDQDREPAILVSKNGPYVVTGGIELSVSEWGEGASREQYTLCRCGGSSNKPFCDGTHWKGFQDDHN